MGGPSGSFWNGNPDADLGSLYSFLDVQCMCGSRASSFLWKYDRMSGGLCCVFLEFSSGRKRTAKNVSGIREDDQQKMDPAKRNFTFCGSDGVCNVMMFYVFHMKDGLLYSGFSVYGDYAPHTAMMRSFSRGNNFPTQYPHYGGQDVKYHFMFQFLVGNLEYLGLRLDLGYNLVSIMSLSGFLMVLYGISYRMFRSFWAGAAAMVFFFFRSGTAFWQYLWENAKAGNLIQALEENTAFIGYTTNENWGLWNFNVYLNQRHLAFGLLIVAVAVWIFMDWVEAGCGHKEHGWLWISKRFFTKEAWAFRNVEIAILLGLFLGLTAFWNGAALIGGLLILAGFAVFSDGKLDYAVCAALAVFFSELQSKIFVSGSVMSPSFYWGFLAENKSISGVLWYLVEISGFFFVGMIVASVFFKEVSGQC